jgi:CRISPR/Cas system-associated exonuclease Cas4 (RecB family)
LVEELLKWFEKLKTKVESNIIPMRLADYPDNWQCQGCQYREICEIAGEKELNWEEFKQKIESIKI